MLHYLKCWKSFRNCSILSIFQYYLKTDKKLKLFKRFYASMKNNAIWNTRTISQVSLAPFAQILKEHQTMPKSGILTQARALPAIPCSDSWASSLAVDQWPDIAAPDTSATSGRVGAWNSFILIYYCYLLLVVYCYFVVFWMLLVLEILSKSFKRSK